MKTVSGNNLAQTRAEPLTHCTSASMSRATSTNGAPPLPTKPRRTPDEMRRVRASLPAALPTAPAVQKQNPVQHAAQIVSFLRAREHEFRYRGSVYPDPSMWGNRTVNDLKRKLGGTSHQVLNCWGLVFYTHFRTGNLSKRDLDARANFVSNLADGLTDRIQRSQIRLQHIRSDLVGNINSVPVEYVDFTAIAPGSTLVFNEEGRGPSHAAIMLDNGQMAHLVQSTTSREALVRPDVANGTLEITTPVAVLAIVRNMQGRPGGIEVAYTPGPLHFVPSRTTTAAAAARP